MIEINCHKVYFYKSEYETDGKGQMLYCYKTHEKELFFETKDKALNHINAFIDHWKKKKNIVWDKSCDKDGMYWSSGQYRVELSEYKLIVR